METQTKTKSKTVITLAIIGGFLAAAAAGVMGVKQIQGNSCMVAQAYAVANCLTKDKEVLMCSKAVSGANTFSNNGMANCKTAIGFLRKNICKTELSTVSNSMKDKKLGCEYEKEWNFSNAGDYTYDANKIEVANNMAVLKHGQIEKNVLEPNRSRVFDIKFLYKVNDRIYMVTDGDIQVSNDKGNNWSIVYSTADLNNFPENGNAFIKSRAGNIMFIAGNEVYINIGNENTAGDYIKMSQYNVPQAFREAKPTALMQSQDKKIWIGTDKGLFRINGITRNDIENIQTMDRDLNLNFGAYTMSDLIVKNLFQINNGIIYAGLVAVNGDFFIIRTSPQGLGGRVIEEDLPTVARNLMRLFMTSERNDNPYALFQNGLYRMGNNVVDGAGDLVQEWTKIRGPIGHDPQKDSIRGLDGYFIFETSDNKLYNCKSAGDCYNLQANTEVEREADKITVIESQGTFQSILDMGNRFVGGGTTSMGMEPQNMFIYTSKMNYDTSKPSINNTQSLSYYLSKEFSAKTSITENELVRFQLKKGNQWYYWNGNNWVVAQKDNYDQANDREVVKNHIASFPNDGQLQWNAMLSSDGNQRTELDSVKIKYKKLGLE